MIHPLTLLINDFNLTLLFLCQKSSFNAKRKKTLLEQV